jgi:hypothetical protein
MHFHSASFDVPSLITAIEANVQANMWAQTRSDTGIIEYVLTPLDGFGASTLHSTGLPAKWKGTQALGDTIPQVAALVKLSTVLRGRNWRGRVYLPFPSEDVCNSSILTPTPRAAMQTAWDAFRTGMSAASKQWLVASYKLAGSADVTASFVEQLLGTQRRRQPRP